MQTRRGVGGGHHLHPDARGARLPRSSHGLAQSCSAFVAGVDAAMNAGFCVEAYNEAVRVAGRAPEIMNTDQGASSPARNGSVQ